jgi:hypothetical protein
MDSVAFVAALFYVSREKQTAQSRSIDLSRLPQERRLPMSRMTHHGITTIEALEMNQIF